MSKIHRNEEKNTINRSQKSSKTDPQARVWHRSPGETRCSKRTICVLNCAKETVFDRFNVRNARKRYCKRSLKRKLTGATPKIAKNRPPNRGRVPVFCAKKNPKNSNRLTGQRPVNTGVGDVQIVPPAWGSV